MTRRALVVKCDKRGRLFLPESFRKTHGDRFVILEARGDIVLIPIPRDQLKALEEIGKPLRGLTIPELKAEIRKQADEEALRSLR